MYAYTRESEGKKFLVVLNFKSIPATVNTGIDVSIAKIILGNYSSPVKGGKLQPYEAIVYEL